MSRRVPSMRLHYDQADYIFNFLKYNRFYEDLEKSDFKFVKSEDDHWHGTKKYYTMRNDKFIYDLVIIGNITNVLDEADSEFISRLAGYSDEKQFVPLQFEMRVSTYPHNKQKFEYETKLISDMSVDSANCSFSVDITSSELICVLILCNISDMIDNSGKSYCKFMSDFDLYFKTLIGEIKDRFNENDFDFSTNKYYSRQVYNYD